MTIAYSWIAVWKYTTQHRMSIYVCSVYLEPSPAPQVVSFPQYEMGMRARGECENCLFIVAAFCTRHILGHDPKLSMKGAFKPLLTYQQK
jgi:hypothetical protein